jgi:hypothetical protein
MQLDVPSFDKRVEPKEIREKMQVNTSIIKHVYSASYK